MYISGLSKDVSFIRFLSVVGEKAVEWIVAKKFELPVFDLSKYVLRLETNQRVCEHQCRYALTALPMLSLSSARNNNGTLQIGIYACIHAWLQSHTCH